MARSGEVHYPESDGQPVAETEWHFDALRDLVDLVRERLGDEQVWHVAGNQLFYYEEGNNRRSFAPDVYAVRGVPQRPPARIWKLWELPARCLALVVELSSDSSHIHDVQGKRELYEALGVEEYVVFDVLRESRDRALRTWRREGDALVEQAQPVSQILNGARWRVEDWRLRLETPEGQRLLVPRERAEAEAARATAEAARAESAAARAESEAARAESEAARAESEAARAESEAARATAAEARMRAAEAELARLRRGE